MGFKLIGEPSDYSTSGYLFSLSAKLHGFGERVSEDFYLRGRSDDSRLKGNWDAQNKVLMSCNLVTLLFDRGYFSKREEYIEEFSVILQNYLDKDKDYKTLLEREEFSSCTEVEKYLLKNIILMFNQKPLEV